MTPATTTVSSSNHTGRISSIPAIGIKKSDWEFIKNSPDKSIEIQYSTNYKNIESTNIIFDLQKENQSKKTIVIGAHYDSWYDGCHDNCIAVQLLVDILESINNNKEKKLSNPIRAIFFDAEELSLIGSRFHVNNNQDVDNYGFYLNLEMFEYIIPLIFRCSISILGF